MIPTEHEYTAATHAAARAVHDADIAARRKVFPPSAHFAEWDDLGPAERRIILQAVLPLVDAAISAIPDRLDAVRSILDAPFNDDEQIEALTRLVGH